VILILRNWRLIGLAMLLTALGIQTWRLSSEKAHSAALMANSALQVANYRAAYQQAVALAYADKIAKEKEYEAARQSSAATYAGLSADYRAAVLRLTARANPGGGGKADMPIASPSAGLPADPATGAFIFVSTDDALICGENTAYAQAAYEWARELEAVQ